MDPNCTRPYAAGRLVPDKAVYCSGGEEQYRHDQIGAAQQSAARAPELAFSTSLSRMYRATTRL
jgi:hypothetical protein